MNQDPQPNVAANLSNEELLRPYHTRYCDSGTAWAPRQTKPRDCDCGLIEAVKAYGDTRELEGQEHLLDELEGLQNEAITPSAFVTLFVNFKQAKRNALKQKGEQ